jgi:lipoprotein NlpD
MRVVSPPSLPRAIVPTEPGIFHTVTRGETLWRISRTYQISLGELARVNRITNVHSLEVGQKLFVPNRLRADWRSSKPIREFPAPREFSWPARGTVVRYFEQQQLGANNRGIDIKVKAEAPVYAAAEGKVVFTTGNMRGYGGTVIVEHNGGFTTVYSFNRQILVRSGDLVKQGQQLAVAGSCGRSSECVVHFELRKNNVPQNPLFYLP